MSVEIQSRIICDGCGEILNGPLCNRTTYCDESYFKAKKEAKKRKWVELRRYGPTRHFCDKCADGYVTFAGMLKAK